MILGDGGARLSELSLVIVVARYWVYPFVIYVRRVRVGGWCIWLIVRWVFVNGDYFLLFLCGCEYMKAGHWTDWESN